jgi:protein-S-isoprenylcysteine O-methyltransferase Ste14
MALAMWAIQQFSPSLTIQSALNLPLATLFAIAGVVPVVIGGKEFFKNETTVNPINPEKTTSLVTSGIYGYSRNPMYVGFALSLLAWAALLGSYTSLIGIPLFIWTITKSQIIPEEIALEQKFGESFLEYKKHVRRWL